MDCWFRDINIYCTYPKAADMYMVLSGLGEDLMRIFDMLQLQYRDINV